MSNHKPECLVSNDLYLTLNVRDFRQMLITHCNKNRVHPKNKNKNLYMHHFIHSTPPTPNLPTPYHTTQHHAKPQHTTHTQHNT